MTLTDAAVLVGIGLGVGGFLVTVWQQWVGYRDRRSAQRQHLYEMQTSIVRDFCVLDTDTEAKIREAVVLIVNQIQLESASSNEKVLDEIYNVLIPQLNTLEAKLAQSMSLFANFMPKEAVTVAEMVYALHYLTIEQIKGTRYHDPDNSQISISGIYSMLHKDGREMQKELLAITRDFLGVDRLSGDIQGLLGKKQPLSPLVKSMMEKAKADKEMLASTSNNA